MNDIQYFAKKKGSSEPAKPISLSAGKASSVPVKGLLQYKPVTFDIQLNSLGSPKSQKDFKAFLLGYARVSGIKRIRKRGLRKQNLWTTPAMNGRNGGIRKLENRRGGSNEINRKRTSSI